MIREVKLFKIVFYLEVFPRLYFCSEQITRRMDSIRKFQLFSCGLATSCCRNTAILGYLSSSLKIAHHSEPSVISWTAKIMHAATTRNKLWFCELFLFEWNLHKRNEPNHKWVQPFIRITIFRWLSQVWSSEYSRTCYGQLLICGINWNFADGGASGCMRRRTVRRMKEKLRKI